MGFFAEAGPLQVFVSNHLIPEDYEFNTAGEPAYVTADGEQKLETGCEVRLRIVGTRVDASDIVSAGAADGSRRQRGGAGEAHAGCSAAGGGRPRLLRVLGRLCVQSLKSVSAIRCLQFAVGTIKGDYLGVINSPI